MTSPESGPLDGALLASLGNDRRLRHRELRSAGRSSDVVVFPHQNEAGPSNAKSRQSVSGADAIAAEELSRFTQAPSKATKAPDRDGEDDEAIEARTVHLLCRLLALGFVTPLMVTSGKGKGPEIASLTRHNCGILKALAVMRTELDRCPSALDHVFRSRLDSDTSTSEVELRCTTLDLWLAPRLFVAASTSLSRACAESEADAASWLDVHRACLANLHSLLSLSLDSANHLDNVRTLLNEFLRVAVAALVALARPAFLLSDPPPAHLMPIERQRGDVFEVRQNDQGSIGVLRAPLAPNTKFDAPRGRKAEGLGVMNLWMPEDWTTFEIGFSDAESQPHLAHALLLSACSIAMSMTRCHPTSLLDIGRVAQSMFLSAWDLAWQVGDIGVGQVSLPPTLRAARIRIAGQAMREEGAASEAGTRWAKRLAAAVAEELSLASLPASLGPSSADREVPLVALRSLLRECNADASSASLRPLAEAMRIHTPTIVGEMGGLHDSAPDDSNHVMAASSDKRQRDLASLRKTTAYEALLLMLERSMGSPPLTSEQMASLQDQLGDAAAHREAVVGGTAAQDLAHPWLSTAEWRRLREALRRSRGAAPALKRKRGDEEMAVVPAMTTVESLASALKGLASVDRWQLRDVGKAICRLASQNSAPCPLCDDNGDARGADAATLLLSSVPQLRSPDISKASTAIWREVIPSRDEKRLLAAMELLRRSLAHIDPASALTSNWLTAAATRIFALMTDRRRSVRLSAVRLLEMAVRRRCAAHAEGMRPDELRKELEDRILGRLEKLRGASKGRDVEVAILALGALGRIPHEEVQHQVLLVLVLELGGSPLSKALAYTQLTQLSTFYGGTTFQLLSPALHVISPAVVLKMISAPALLLEVLNLTNQSTATFLQSTLHHTLPQLIQKPNHRVLAIVAAETGQRVQEMCYAHTADILKHFVDLEKKQREAGLNMLVECVGSSREPAEMDALRRQLFQGFLVDIIGHLIVKLADPSSEASAHRGLEYVEEVVAGVKRKEGEANAAVTKFLSNEILAILAWINEELVGGHGKKTMSHRAMVVRSVGALIKVVGEPISTVTPQIMATLNSTISTPKLMLPTLESWQIFIEKMRYETIGPFIGQTAATLLACWPRFGAVERSVAKYIFKCIIVDGAEPLRNWISTDVPSLDELQHDMPDICRRAAGLRGRAPAQQLRNILDRVANENASVCSQALHELRRFIASQPDYIRRATSGDMFDPIVGVAISRLLAVVGRHDDSQWEVRDLCFECLGMLGAVDPDRLELAPDEPPRVVLKNFEDADEAVEFAIHLIRDVLVGAFRATEDTKHQAALAFVIQELLKHCGFTSALLDTRPVALKIKQRWNNLPPSVQDTVAPLLNSKYSVKIGDPLPRPQPFYLHSTSYRDWIQAWTNELIMGASNPDAVAIFGIFRTLINNQDLSIAQHILPHLVVHILVSGREDMRTAIHAEICAVLSDQVQATTGYSEERRLSSAQTVFRLLDHISVWVRQKSQERSPQRRAAAAPQNEALAQVKSVISSISTELMARASLRCREFARSLLNFEQRVREMRETKVPEADMQPYYESLHLNYAALEEPDGMEGISTQVIAPSLEHQIREHESTGRWTSAQSCWEVELQQRPDDPDLHLGLLRCLRNLGHYDTMRTHIRGILSSHPTWQPRFSSLEVEASFILSDWDGIGRALTSSGGSAALSSEHMLARVLLAIRQGDAAALDDSIRAARRQLGQPILAASGASSYGRVYDAVAQLHMLQELTMIGQVAARGSPSDKELDGLSQSLLTRFHSTLPSFRIREPLLSLRRSAFSTRCARIEEFSREIGQSWLLTSKMARKTGHVQTAYSAVLQAFQWQAPLAFVQRAKLLALNDQPQAAIQELGNNLKEMEAKLKIVDTKATATLPANRSAPAVVDLTGSDDANTHLLDKKAFSAANLVLAKLIETKGRAKTNDVIAQYRLSTQHDDTSEKANYYLGRYHDSGVDCANPETQRYSVCRYFLKSAMRGTKFFFRTVPRVLTLWFEAGDDPTCLKYSDAYFQAAATGFKAPVKGLPDKKTEQAVYERLECFFKVTNLIVRFMRRMQPYQWLAVLPQLVSRIVHQSDKVWPVLRDIIVFVLESYPNQALWTMIGAAQSTDRGRKQRFGEIVSCIKAALAKAPHLHATVQLIERMHRMAIQLLALCDLPVKNETTLNLTTQFPEFKKLADRSLMLPLQSSITVSLPSDHSVSADHRPFPDNLPRIADFEASVEIMNSLQKPRKLVIVGSDGQRYAFLCKPKDDLRKDARLMEFDAMINKLLQSNSESRKRRLYIRTYAVVTLNEECGLIEWVPNTIGLRHILNKLYQARGIPLFTQEIRKDMETARTAKDGYKTFEEKVLAKYPPVFHEWFLATFPEPGAWLRARLAYGRTLAVMSMVGYVLGLGDRHGENILFDAVSGDTVHVDLNCLFEKGLTFEIAEKVPFRLTQNLVDALGVTGVEGVFRRAAEVSMAILRSNKDTLMSVLEAMIHDPLVEWSVDSRSSKKVRANGPDPRTAEGRKALDAVARKLNGCQREQNAAWSPPRSTNTFVEFLIRDATSPVLLGQMYVGWASYL